MQEWNSLLRDRGEAGSTNEFKDVVGVLERTGTTGQFVHPLLSLASRTASFLSAGSCEDAGCDDFAARAIARSLRVAVQCLRTGG